MMHVIFSFLASSLHLLRTSDLHTHVSATDNHAEPIHTRVMRPFYDHNGCHLYNDVKRPFWPVSYLIQLRLLLT
jgi:hypothetical protein